MTDNEIIKALDNLIHLGDAPIGKGFGVIVDKQTLKEILDLINRLKAEKERLETVIDIWQVGYASMKKGVRELEEQLATAKSEAYKEVSERVIQTICENTHPDFNRNGKPVNVWNAKDGYRAIDDLLKEMG